MISHKWRRTHLYASSYDSQGVDPPRGWYKCQACLTETMAPILNTDALLEVLEAFDEIKPCPAFMAKLLSMP